MTDFMVNFRDANMRCQEKGIYFCLKMKYSIGTVTYIWFLNSGIFTVPLFSFHFYHLSIAENGVVNSPIINLWGRMFALRFSKVSLMWIPLNLEHRCSELRLHLDRLFFLSHIWMSFLNFYDNFWLKIHVVQY